jgi:hypothetical protein
MEKHENDGEVLLDGQLLPLASEILGKEIRVLRPKLVTEEERLVQAERRWRSSFQQRVATMKVMMKLAKNQQEMPTPTTGYPDTGPGEKR